MGGWWRVTGWLSDILKASRDKTPPGERGISYPILIAVAVIIIAFLISLVPGLQPPRSESRAVGRHGPASSAFVVDESGEFVEGFHQVLLVFHDLTYRLVRPWGLVD